MLLEDRSNGRMMVKIPHHLQVCVCLCYMHVSVSVCARVYVYVSIVFWSFYVTCQLVGVKTDGFVVNMNHKDLCHSNILYIIQVASRVVTPRSLPMMLRVCGRQTLNKRFKKLWQSTLPVAVGKSFYQMRARCMVCHCMLLFSLFVLKDIFVLFRS